MQHKESQIQIACVKWFRYQFSEIGWLLFSVPNGADVKLTQARILKAEGMTSGVSDLILLVPRKQFHGLCIEMKTDKGRQSEEQKEFQKRVEKQGYKYIVCRSFDGFRTEVADYLDFPLDIHSYLTER